MRSIDTVMQLRSHRDSDDLVLVKGYWQPADGGGGVFTRVDLPTDPQAVPKEFISRRTATVEGDGGTIIPAVGGGFWVRMFDGPIDVRWFGAWGRPNPLPGGPFPSQPPWEKAVLAGDNGPAFNAALEAAARRAVDTAGTDRDSPGRGTGLHTAPPVYVASGVYPIATTVLVGHYLSLEGDGASALRAAVVSKPRSRTKASLWTVELLRLAGQYHRLEGLLFLGGRHQVVLHGPGPDGAPFGGPPETDAPITIRNCEFRNSRGPAIFGDTDHPQGMSPDGRSYAALWERTSVSALLVDRCRFEGPSAFWGSFDYCTFRDCVVNLKPHADVVDSEGHPLAAFNNGGGLLVDGCYATPGYYEDGDRFKAFASDAAWFQGLGTFNINNCNFGGESVAVTGIRLRSPVWQGRTFQVNFNCEDLGKLQSDTGPDARLLRYRPKVSMHGTNMSSMGKAGDAKLEWNWLEVYPAPALAADRSGPSVPKRHDCRGEPSAVTQALAKARNVPSVIRITGPMPEFVSGDLHDVRLGSGIWISSAIPMEAYAGRDASGLVVDVEDLPAGLRARRSPDPREPGDDLWPVLRQFAVVERSPVANTLYAPPRGPGIWFEDKGSHDLKFFEHFPTQVAAAREVPDHPEMVDGLQVTRYQFAAPDASVGVHFYCARLAAPNPEPWGWDVASGEYVFSCLIRAEREVRVHMGISRLDEQRPRVTRFLPGAPHFQQVWFPFYHLNPNDRDRWDDEAVVGSQPRTLCITVQPTRYRPVPVSDKYTNTFAVGMFAVHPLGAARPS